MKGIGAGFKSETLDGCASSCVLLEGGVGLLDELVSGAAGVLLEELLQLFAVEDGVHRFATGWSWVGTFSLGGGMAEKDSIFCEESWA